jgi:hypothetical protein
MSGEFVMMPLGLTLIGRLQDRNRHAPRLPPVGAHEASRRGGWLTLESKALGSSRAVGLHEARVDESEDTARAR